MKSSQFDPALDRIGDRFIKAGLLTVAQAANAAQLQQSEGLRFGAAAVKLRYITDHDVHTVLSEQFRYPIAADTDSGIALLLAIAHAPSSAEAESIRRIRAEVAIRLEGNTQLAFAVISPNDGEGKSYLAASLAIAFAQAGSRTLLIDANMRDAGLQAFFGVAGDAGLSSMLAGRAARIAGVVVPRFPMLHVLGAGPMPPNPVEILCDFALRSLIDSFEQAFDVVIVDTPAVSIGSDAQIIAQQIGNCLLVGRKDVTTISDLSFTQELLDTAGVRIVGTVYNAFTEVRLAPWRSRRLSKK